MKAFSVFRRFSMAYLWLIVNFSNPLKEMYNYVLRVVVLFVSILCVNVTYSQDHLIEVKRLPGWGKDYLTIVDSKKYLDPIDKTVKTFGYEYYCMMKNGLLVMKINDVSTKGMSEDAFYSILDANDETKLLLMDNSTTDLYLTTVKKMPLPDLFLRYNITPKDICSYTTYRYDRDLSDIQNKIKNRDEKFEKFNAYCTEVIDSDFDWFFASSYDYLITSNDPLIDKKILENFVEHSFLSRLERNTENPDILVTISKNADESITSTYIPPTSRTINEGSKTRTRYNWITGKNEYVTEQNNRTIYEGGYTQTTNNTNIFLEISLLNAKKINDVDQITPPIIWQMGFKRHAVNPAFNILDEYMAYSTWSILCNSWFYKEDRAIKCWLPNYNFSGSTVTEILFDDPNNILKVGDKIIKYKRWKKDKWRPFTDADATEFSTPQWYSNLNSLLYSCKVLRNGKTIELKNVDLRSKSESNYIEFYKWN